MRPALVTVIGGRHWELRVVHEARNSGTARILARCTEPAQVERWLSEADAVTIGVEVPWLGTGIVRRWRAAGVLVVGMADDSSTGFLRGVGCDLVLPASDDPGSVLRAITVASTQRSAPRSPIPGPVTVVGPRGAPGRSEIALSLAHGLSRIRPTTLVELDSQAPSLGLRAGLRPRPDITDADLHPIPGDLQILTSPAANTAIGSSVVYRIIAASLAEGRYTVCDAGPPPARPVFDGPAVVVCDPSEVGLVRVARMLSTWDGTAPYLVVNRVRPDQIERSVVAVRSATGLEPDAVVPKVATLPRTAPSEEIVAALQPVIEGIVSRYCALR